MNARGTRSRRSDAAVSSPLALALRLAGSWWRQLLALACACAVVAATIAGAVGVGEALRDGLRRLALERLGGISAALVADDVFGAETARRLSAPDGTVEPAIVLEVTYESTAGETARGTLLACDAPASLGFDPAPPTPGNDEVALNDILAATLGVAVGDSVVMRVSKRSAVPADSPLGRRVPESLGRRVKVASILPPRGIGRFSLAPAQVTRGMALATLGTAQALLGRGDVVNTALGAGGAGATGLRRALSPALGDYGLTLEDVGGGVLRLSSRALLLAAEVDRAAEAVLRPAGGVPTLAFLATAIVPASGDTGAMIPYSTLLGTETTALPVGALVGTDGTPLDPPDDDAVVIDEWMAEDLAAQGHPVAVGDRLAIRFFRPETLHGRVEEATESLRISGIARMEGAATARSLVPEVEGISDEKSIADWDPPFPFDRGRVRTVPPHDEDDRYWKLHGTTPKAFVSLGRARRIAGGRFGATTAWFLPDSGAGQRDLLAARLAAAITPERMGIRVDDVRGTALAAARGSTPFGSLFLALSSFVVAAGLLLEWLLFQLLVAARRRDVGLLAAVGWPPRRIALLLTTIGAAAATVGVAVGTAAGPAWARILLAALARSWNASVASGSNVAFGDGTISWTRLWPGALAALVLSLVALALAARRAARLPPLALLRGGESGSWNTDAARSRGTLLGVSALGAAVLAAALAGRADARMAVGLFFLSGALALVGLLGLVRVLLSRVAAAREPLASTGGLAWRGLAWRPGRAFAVAAIVAVAEFLVVAVSAFSLSPPARPRERSGPTGGYTSIATFAASSSVDPEDGEALSGLGLEEGQRDALAAATIDRIRASSGDDASCTNLYAPSRPVVLGVGDGFVARGGFRFTGHRPLPASSGGNPWRLLGAGAEGPVPAILDDATARWALKLGGVGARFAYPDDEGKPVEFEIVGLLEPGILQGFVIVAERDFERVFPSRSGYTMALVDAGTAEPAVVDRAVRAAWVDAGASVEATLERLRRLSAVQNTFLAAFQALGTLGLLLGTAGVAAVQVQGVLERVGTFGLLGALGFPRGMVRRIVVAETLCMVGLGLVAGAAAGAMTLPAHLVGGRASVPTAWIAATCLATLAVALLAGVAATRALDRLTPREALASRS